jgi:hypothetical protein
VWRPVVLAASPEANPDESDQTGMKG